MRLLRNVMQLILDTLVHTGLTRQINVASASLRGSLRQLKATVQSVRTNHVDHSLRLGNHRLDAIQVFCRRDDHTNAFNTLLRHIRQLLDHATDLFLVPASKRHTRLLWVRGKILCGHASSEASRTVQNNVVLYRGCHARLLWQQRECRLQVPT